MHKDHVLMNKQAAEAAQWMHDEIRRNHGTLSQEAAWQGVHAMHGDALARDGEGGHWLTRPVLIAFRKLVPNAVWEPERSRWQEPQSEKSCSK